MNSKRIWWMDNLKAFAIILVVMGHSVSKEGYAYKWICSYTMPLFFMLSGMSFFFVMKKGNDSFKKQLVNLIILFVGQSFFYIILNLVGNMFIKTTVSVTVQSFFLCLVYPVAHFWYLQSLIIIYLVEFLLERFVKDDRWRFVICVVLFCLGGLTNYSKALYDLLFFELGRQAIRRNRFLPGWVGIPGAIFGFIFTYFSNDYNMITIGITSILACSYVILWVDISKKFFDKSYKAFTGLGTNCIWIYCFHSYFTAVARTLNQKILGGSELIGFCLMMIAGLAGPIVVMIVCKKMKIDQYIMRPYFSLLTIFEKRKKKKLS